MAKKEQEKSDITEASRRLRARTMEEKSKVGEIKAQIEAVMASYDDIDTDLERIVEESRKQAALHVVTDDERAFSQAVQGSKGTGLQKSHRLVTLRQLRFNRGATLRELHEEIDIPFPHLSEIERGTRSMSLSQQEKYEKWAGGRIHYRMVPYVESPEEE